MVSNSKVLTVSYGTFSCTLEGFDDSFDTMKAIAEYFRDLASDDRYFGAEPPTPDAEMLARIAEREIARRVQAREESGGFILTAEAKPDAVAEPKAQEVAAEPAPAPEPVGSPQAEAEIDTPADAAAPVEADEEEIADASDIADIDPIVDTVATPETAAPEVTQDVAEATVPDIPEADAVATDGAAAPQTAPIQTIAEPAQPEPEPLPAAPSADAAVSLLDDSSVAAKLQRIRAVVSRGTVQTVETDYTEDEHADDFIAAAANEIEEVIEADDQAELAAEDVEEENYSSILDAVARAKTDAEEAAAEAKAEPEDIAGDETAPEQRDQQPEAETAKAPEGPVENAAETQVSAPEEIAPEQAAAQPARPVRVLKMKRSDFEAALSSGHLEEHTDIQEDEPESSLSPEEEADLLRELAEVEAEFAEDEEELEADDVRSIFAAEDAPEEETAPEEPGRAQLEEPDVSRLMEKTQSEMDNPEGAHRRNAIAHLRAAVAATRAETEAGGGLNRGDDSVDAFRDDLESVVRPRRPVRPQTHAERPESPRPAPLKLVASQRIDAPAETAPAAAAITIKPRRVSLKPAADTSANQAAISDYKSFAEFAEAMGAEKLPDLLEAAAAYLSYVEGHEQFSRPQLMNKARQVEENAFSREDGLRSFGQLLRQGKIEKLQGGRFTVSDQIGFKPKNRAAG
ncbi:hypothetical protein TG4357_01994 [Thalassovita gelatinovora]|uniref:Chemotaxis protein CheA n=1 Tax=Thalassovita gelatinovora TaxID=53501 RepID=A0A0N7LV95_THAGE|nr:hypothetical protein [Thalassovita gelatinovora]QIZ80003.1 hypothetical protein HFZ77_05645 [Thalassovita gelatinovora]CUH65674.1 hypothetical protein TG4357_01994 [Thalassovita gelatinovora]SER05209.1 hypothetical protein SAMN04488043_11459 [Thalassovita gelatinovora]